MGRLLVPWGVPQTAARLYGYLVLTPEPVTLERIASDLGVGKSTASVAARLLEMYTLARKRRVRGSRRVLYEASEDFEGMVSEQKQLLLTLADLFREHARLAPEKARGRLLRMAEFDAAMGEAIGSALGQWRTRKRP